MANKNRNHKPKKKPPARKTPSPGSYRADQAGGADAPPGGTAAPVAKKSPRHPAPSPQAPAASLRARLLAWSGFCLVLAACVGWVLAHAYLVDTVTVRLCEKMDAGIPEDKRMPVFLSEIAFDGYTWNRHAEKLGENGSIRLRHTDLDNAPEGREVHWNSAFAWYLRGLGEIYRLFHPDTLRNSIFRMSIWANPILLILALGIFSTLSARRFGPLCGTVLAIGMVAVPTFYEGFMPAYPDHHGIIAFTMLGMLFGIAWAGAGWVQAEGGTDFAPPHSLKQARHGMIFSGICGAAGLWISAFSAAVVALGIGLGVIGAALASSLHPQGKTNSTYHPELWKIWGTATAIAGLAFYLFEYFPDNFRLGLEVNHPLYLLAWFAGGAAISCISKWIFRTDRKFANFPITQVALCAIACALIPLAILGGGQRLFALMDPFMLKLGVQIAETLPLLTRIKHGGLTWATAIGWFPVFILAAILLQFVKQVGRGTKYCLLVLSIPIVFITAMQFLQTRWGMLAGPLYIALAGLVIPQVWQLVPRNPASRSIVALALLASAWLFVSPTLKNTFSLPWAQFESGEKIALSPGQGLALIHRQMARAILDSAEGKPVVLLSSPNSSCLLSSIGGFQTIGTLYWENVAGLKSAAAGLNAQSDAEALEFIKSHGVTHISLMSWENFIEPYFRIIHPSPTPGISFQNSFGKRALFDKVIPPWARPLPFPPNPLTSGLQQNILMLQVAPNQSVEEAKLHLARYVRLVEGNPIAAEVALKQALDAEPGSIPVRVELAELFLSQRRYQEALEQYLSALKVLKADQRKSFAESAAAKLVAAGNSELAAKLLSAASEANIAN